MQIRIEDQESLLIVRNYFPILSRRKKGSMANEIQREQYLWILHKVPDLWPELRRKNKAWSSYDEQSCENALRPNTTKLAANVSG